VARVLDDLPSRPSPEEALALAGRVGQSQGERDEGEGTRGGDRRAASLHSMDHGALVSLRGPLSGPRSSMSRALGILEALSLAFCSLQSLESIVPALRQLTRLRLLDLTGNAICDLSATSGTDKDGTTDAADGGDGTEDDEAISRPCALSCCGETLEVLVLSDNRIASLRDLPSLRDALPRLKALSLQYNPVS